jgi:CDGSH-type Zn-finger protein
MGGIWKLTKNSHNPKFKKAAEEEACNCPSGRLIVWNKKTGKAIEPKLKQSLGLIEDPAAKSSGPIWARGGIEIESADGKKYEKRNQVTLCRCGKSRNKPFCYGMHIPYRFSDGDKSLK